MNSKLALRRILYLASLMNMDVEDISYSITSIVPCKIEIQYVSVHDKTDKFKDIFERELEECYLGLIQVSKVDRLEHPNIVKLHKVIYDKPDGTFKDSIIKYNRVTRSFVIGTPSRVTLEPDMKSSITLLDYMAKHRG